MKGSLNDGEGVRLPRIQNDLPFARTLDCLSQPRGPPHPDADDVNQKRAAINLSYKFIPSPIGGLKLVASDEGLAAVLWENDNPRRVRPGSLIENPEHPILLRVEKELNEYFRGKRKAFTVPLDMRGTHFQEQVWEALLGIPYGETRSYGQLANQLRNPNATRAVGAANGRNPIAIIVRCHRVIGFDGKLTGFAGGLDAKAHLLKLESQQLSQPETKR